ncbi:hypothetical protein [uncultured Friedmanniella sp.]|uniref:hypothetical protein n=1 Tax=uncultured Friedmanniella sp. TaxID=335381 RepID=UPI0035CB5CCD
MKTSTKIATAALATLALAGTVGVGIAAADPTPAPTPGSSASPTATTTDAKKHRPLIARSLHGEVTLAGKKHRVVDFQRGTVSTVSGTSITVHSADGFTKTYRVSAKTKVRSDKKAATIAAVKIHDRVRVVATHKGSTVTANRIADRGAK